MGVRVLVPMQSATGVPLEPRLVDYIGARYTYRQADGHLYVLEGSSTVADYGPGQWVGVEDFPS